VSVEDKRHTGNDRHRGHFDEVLVESVGIFFAPGVEGDEEVLRESECVRACCPDNNNEIGVG